MRFHSWVVHALALMALSSSFSGSQQGVLFARAEEAPTTSETAAEEVTNLAPAGAEKFAFEAEVSRMLDIVVNSLYQNKDVFLRELISNASDALDKIRYLVLTEPEKFKEAEEYPFEVKIEYDDKEQTLTIRDTGVGMTKAEMITNLGTVARSGTGKFMEALKESNNPEATVSQIGQFGVGFYATFLVADRVTVVSKNPTDPVQHVWESTNGASDFVVYEDPRGNTLGRGTEITLHLKEDCREYADKDRITELAKHYSEFVTHPISLRTVTVTEVEVEDEEEEATDEEPKSEDDELEIGDEDDADAEEEKPKKTKEVTSFEWEHINSDQALWTRDKDEISDEEYQNFWKTLTDDSTDAANWVHFNAEGNINFKSILYLPEDVPPQYRLGSMDSIKGSMKLYVRKVLISDEFELLPKYLGFIRGVVDSDDLPLNVNRETLQESKILQVIRKKLVRKAIDLIRTYAKEADKEEDEEEKEVEIDEDGNVIETDDEEKEKRPSYGEWYKKFAPALKLGVMDDEPNRGKLLKLLRYPSSKSDGKLISLETYVENMKDWQEEIYVLGGTTIEELEKSPFLEPFKEKDVEVLYLIDPIDEYMTKEIRDFNDKKFVQISSESVRFKDEDQDLIKRREKAYKDKFNPLLKYLRKLYSGSVMRVQVAKRALGTVPAIVTSSEFGSSANMERILRAQAFQQGMQAPQTYAMKVLELNPRHPLVVKLLEGAPPEKKDDDDEEAEEPFEPTEETVDAAWMLHDMALINGGFPIADPEAHNKRLMKVVQASLGVPSLDLEPEIDPPVEEDEPPEPDINVETLNMADFDSPDMDLDDMNEHMKNFGITPEDIEKMKEEAA